MQITKKERNEDGISGSINSLLVHIKKQLDEYYNDIIHMKYRTKFADIILHFTMIQFDLKDYNIQ